MHGATWYDSRTEMPNCARKLTNWHRNMVRPNGDYVMFGNELQVAGAEGLEPSTLGFGGLWVSRGINRLAFPKPTNSSRRLMGYSRKCLTGMRSSAVEQRSFNPTVLGSIPSAFTSTPPDPHLVNEGDERMRYRSPSLQPVAQGEAMSEKPQRTTFRELMQGAPILMTSAMILAAIAGAWLSSVF